MKKIISLFMALALVLGCTCLPNGLGKAFDISINSSAYMNTKCTSIKEGFELKWNAVNVASKYTIVVSEFDKSDPLYIKTQGTSYETKETSYKLTGLKAGKRYNIYINNNGNDDWDAALNVVPLGDKFTKTSDGFIIGTDSQNVKFAAGYEGTKSTVTLPAEVKYIDDYAFADNFVISNLTIPSTCSGKIGEGAFYFCALLKSLRVKGDIEKVGLTAFASCVDLETVTFGGNIHADKDKGGIDTYAFIYNIALRSVKFEKKDATVDKIGDGAFFSCIKLSSINMPSNTLELGMIAFANCSSLTKLNVPSSVKKIGDCAFGYACDIFNSFETTLATGVTKSEIFYMDSDGEYKNVKVTQPKLYATVLKGSEAEKYCKAYNVTYTTVAYTKKSTETTTKSTSTKLAAPKVKATGSDKAVTLTWDKVTGADAYKVYKYNASTKKYEVYKTVTDTSCTVTGLTNGTKYTF